MDPEAITWGARLITVPLMVIWGGLNIWEGKRIGGTISLIGAAFLAYDVWRLA